jgi:hypothetical protein
VLRVGQPISVIHMFGGRRILANRPANRRAAVPGSSRGRRVTVRMVFMMSKYFAPPTRTGVDVPAAPPAKPATANAGSTDPDLTVS